MQQYIIQNLIPSPISITDKLLRITQHQGVEQFRSALELAPQNQSAYFGLASALLAWARHCVTVGAFGWAASLLKVIWSVSSFLG
jgi:hypothetical protein